MAKFLQKLRVWMFVLLGMSLSPVFSSVAFAKTAYIGILGQGAGQGMMGHSFLLITDTPGQFLSSIVYQYSIRIPEGVNFGVETITQLNTFPFIVDKLEGWNFIKTFTEQDQLVMMYQLKLSDEQVAQLETNVEADRIKREETPHYDYAVEVRNCATKVYDQVNAFLPDELKIRYTSPVQALFTFNLLGSDQVAMSVPLSAAPQLEVSPIVNDVVQFRQSSMVELEVAQKTFAQLKPAFSSCGVSEASQVILLRMYGNLELRFDGTYLRAYRGLLEACVKAKPELKEVYNSHLDFLRMKTEDQKFLQLSETFYLN